MPPFSAHRLDAIPFRVDSGLLLRRLRLEPDSEPAPEILALAARAETVGRPKALFGETYIEKTFPDGIQVAGVRFTSRAMAITLQGKGRIFPYLATCGIELDAIPIPADDLLGQFALEMIKEQALRTSLAALRERLLAQYGLEAKASMNPGSGDRSLWPIEEQRRLFALFGDTQSAIGLRLTDSCLMLPNKSVSGFYFRSEQEFHNCQLCRRDPCQNRRAPFDANLWKSRMDDVGIPAH